MTSDGQATAMTDMDARRSRTTRLAIIGTVVVLAIAAIVVWATRTSSAPTGTISVTASRSVYGSPNRMSFSIGVSNTASSASAALALNSTRISSLEHALETHGVEPSDLQTANLSVGPTYARNGQIDGFSVTNQLEVTLTKLKLAGAAIDAAVKAAGRGIDLYGISFSISGGSDMLNQARAAAMSQAREQAQSLASAAGESVEGISKVTESESSTQPATYYPFGYGTATSDHVLEALPSAISSGRQALSVQVSATFEVS